MVKNVEMSAFMKNLSIIGAALMIFAFFASAGDAIGFQMVGPLFDIDLG